MKLKHSKVLLFLAFLLFFSNNVLSEEGGKVKGIVVSNEDNRALISATVVLHKSKDSSVAGGAITDKSGNFTLTAAVGSYYLEIKYIGFETKYVDSIKLVLENVQELDTIKLLPDNVLQEGVTVEAEKELVEIGIDSRKYNITKDITAGESNVLDVLRKIPSVEVDMDDNVKMNGKSPKILIDGRESPLSDKDMLKTLNSDIVESVELITNPSAKYESEGVTGIIDIKLKKEIDKGFNAMINAGYGSDFEFKYNDNANAGINANLKLGKMNIFARANYYNYNYSSDWSGIRKTWSSPNIDNIVDTIFNNRYGDNKGGSKSIMGSIGIDYEFTKKDAMTFGIDYRNSGWSSESYSKYDINNSIDKIQDYKEISDNNSNNFNGTISLYYKKEFDEKTHNLYVDVYYNNNGGTSDNNLDYYYYPVTETDTLYKRLFNNSSDDPTNDFTFKVDYEKTFKLLGNFGAGIKTNNEFLNNNAKSYQYNYLTNNYELNKLLSDEFDYNNGIYSAYFTLGKMWTSFSYRIGLRTEYTDWKFTSFAADTTFRQNYLSVMPSIHLKYMIGFTHTFGVGYSRRLQRPWYSQLNPYITMYDSTTINSGNPDLLPAYYNSYSAEYMLFTPNTTINTSFSFNNTDNSSESYSALNDWGGIVTRPINAGMDQNLSASLSVQQKITEWWNVNVYASLYHSKMAAPSLGISSREQTSWSANASTYIKIFDNFRINSFFFYSPSSITLQGSNAAWVYLGTGASYSMFDDKLSLRFSLNNLIINKNSEYISFGDNFYSKSYANWQHRSFSIGISYKINDYKESMKRMNEEGGGGQGGTNTGGGGRI